MIYAFIMKCRFILDTLACYQMNASQPSLTSSSASSGIRVHLSSFWPTSLACHKLAIPFKLISADRSYQTRALTISSCCYLRIVVRFFGAEVASAAFPLPTHPPTLVNCFYLWDWNCWLDCSFSFLKIYWDWSCYYDRFPPGDRDDFYAA
jgi:hypothetical protein